MKLFHDEISKLKDIFGKNGYDNKFVDKCLQIFLNKIYTEKIPQDNFLEKIFIPPSIWETVSKFKFKDKISKEMCSFPQS